MPLDRLERVSPSLVSSKPDEVLEDIVVQAGRVASAPIALVSLVLEEVQWFRAHVGLPPSLAVSRATSACDSFCQFVVDEEDTVAIDDAMLDFSVPQNLVQRLGIRAYLGHPVQVGGATLGSLCVIDTRPRSWSPTIQEATLELARRASGRLEQLVTEDEAPWELGQRYSAELGTVFRVIEAEAEGRLTDEDAQIALSVLEQPLARLQAFDHDADLQRLLRDQFGDDTESLLARVRERFNWAVTGPSSDAKAAVS